MKDYSFEDIIKVVQREKNKSRKFLFLNLLQGKYVPSNPQETLELFQTLGKKLARKYNEKQICIIGFAETATAIAAAVAGCFQQNVYFLHTTREILPKQYFITEFQEEHSHAKKHRLYCQNREILQKSDVLILVDDEFTTGKTVCNFVKSLREGHIIGEQCKVIAASLINCMKEEHLQRFQNENIEYEYLLHKDADWEKVNWKCSERQLNLEGKDIEGQNLYINRTYNKKEKKFQKQNRAQIDIGALHGKLDPRLGVYQSEYQNACKKFLWNMMEQLQSEKKKTEEILLLGTEEFMYPVIYAADKIQKLYPKQRYFVHATSRSPIIAMNEPGYPIYNRDKMISVYEKEREVYIYNLRKYNKVIIVTDAEKITEEAKTSIEIVMRKYGNQNWRLLQWIE